MSAKTEITEEDVAAFIHKKHAELQEAARQKYVSVRAETDCAGVLTWRGYAADTGSETGASIETVIDKLAEMSGPLHRAAKLRADAAHLLAQAGVLETAAREGLDA